MSNTVAQTFVLHAFVIMSSLPCRQAPDDCRIGFGPTLQARPPRRAETVSQKLLSSNRLQRQCVRGSDVDFQTDVDKQSPTPNRHA
jgi:hypothetical protein